MDRLTELADAAAHGDERALEALVVELERPVRALCRALTDAADVDDVTQDALLRIVRAVPAYRLEAPAIAWALSIARRACADEVRRATRRRRADLRGAELARERARDRGSDPHDATLLDALVRGLDDDRRLAFALTQLVGLSYEEAAAVCGCPVGTIRSRVARARADLLEALRAGELGTA